MRTIVLHVPDALDTLISPRAPRPQAPREITDEDRRVYLAGLLGLVLADMDEPAIADAILGLNGRCDYAILS